MESIPTTLSVFLCSLNSCIAHIHIYCVCKYRYIHLYTHTYIQYMQMQFLWRSDTKCESSPLAPGLVASTKKNSWCDGYCCWPYGESTSYTRRRRREEAISMPLSLCSSLIYQPGCFLQRDPEAERADEPTVQLLSQGRSRWAAEANPIHPPTPPKGFCFTR